MTRTYTTPLLFLLYVILLYYNYLGTTSLQGFTDPYFSSHTIEKLTNNIFTNTSSMQKGNSLAAIKQAATSATVSPLIDILVSNVWPSLLTSFSSTLPHLSAIPPGAPPFDDVVRRAKPRYLFAVGGGSPPQFWEREPFVWDEEEGRVSRFISLGAFGGNVGTQKKPRVRHFLTCIIVERCAIHFNAAVVLCVFDFNTVVKCNCAVTTPKRNKKSLHILSAEALA